jgi:hypothetical protein
MAHRSKRQEKKLIKKFVFRLAKEDPELLKSLADLALIASQRGQSRLSAEAIATHS